MENPNYNCSQSDLIVVIKTGLASAVEYLAALFAFSPMYTIAFINGLEAETDAADDLPDEASRRLASNLLHLSLITLNKADCTMWQALKRYISKLFTGETLDFHLEAAGQGYYTKALGKSWPSTRSLLKSGSKYATDNNAALIANNNMPLTFAADMTTALAAYSTMVTDYESSKEAIPVATQEKVVALNAIYKKFMDVMRDGQQVFKDDEVIYRQFVFAEILGKVSGPGLAGIRGLVLNITDNQPIASAIATLTLIADDEVPLIYTAFTDDGGNYVINCPSGDYKLQFTAPGFLPSSIKDATVSIGTVSTINEKLTPEE